MRETMGLDKDEAHIASFNAEQCSALIAKVHSCADLWEPVAESRVRDLEDTVRELAKALAPFSSAAERFDGPPSRSRESSRTIWSAEDQTDPEHTRTWTINIGDLRTAREALERAKACLGMGAPPTESYNDSPMAEFSDGGMPLG